MKLTLPLPTNLANSRAHWARKHREQGVFARKCDYMVTEGKVPRPPATPVERAAVHCTLYLCGKPMDQDNAGARMKWVLDWLVRSRYLAGDDPGHLPRFSVSQVRVKHRHEAKVVVEVTEMAREAA